MLINGSSYTGTASTIIFTSVNKITLDTNWTKYYFDGVYNYNLNTIFKVAPNQFWLFGGRGNNNGVSNRPTTIKVDSIGNILSIKEFTNLIKYETKVSYFDTTTKLIYFAGRNLTFPQNPIEFIACMDTLGNVIWNNQSIGPVNFGQIERKNNYVVVSGSKWFSQTGNFGDYKLHLIKLNASNGAIQWSKSYSDKNIGNLATSFVINNDESVVTAGTIKIGAINSFLTHDGVLLKVNSSGDSLWMKTYGNFMSGTQEVFYDIKKTSDGGYIACGVPFYATDPTSQSWVVKTDSVGISPGITTGLQNVDLNIQEVTVYPNPALNKIRINSKHNIFSDNSVYVQIFDMLGKQVLTQFLTTQNKEIDISNLAEGSYILQIKSDNTFYKSKLIVSR